MNPQSNHLRKIRKLKSIGWLGYSRIIVVSHRLPIKIVIKNGKKRLFYSDFLKMKL